MLRGVQRGEPREKLRLGRGGRDRVERELKTFWRLAEKASRFVFGEAGEVYRFKIGAKPISALDQGFQWARRF